MDIARQRALLGMFKPETYAICLGKEGKELERLGLVEWVPPVWGNTNNWAITDAGRALLAHRAADKETD